MGVDVVCTYQHGCGWDPSIPVLLSAIAAAYSLVLGWSVSRRSGEGTTVAVGLGGAAIVMLLITKIADAVVEIPSGLGLLVVAMPFVAASMLDIGERPELDSALRLPDPRRARTLGNRGAVIRAG